MRTNVQQSPELGYLQVEDEAVSLLLVLCLLVFTASYCQFLLNQRRNAE